MEGIIIECGRVDPATLQACLDALTLVDVAQWRAAGGLKPLRDAGVFYKREKRADGGIGPRKERWLSSLVLRKKGHGDCEDLASDTAAAAIYRAGAPYLVGEGAAARAFPERSGAGWHIKVKLRRGGIVDPSRALGMGKGRRR